MEIRSLDAEIVTRAAKKGEREIVSFVASTASPDRYGDVINQRGWSLAKFQRNPVILLNHNANQLPIGRGDVEIVDGKLMVDVEFDMGDPVAAEVARKTKAGFMSAVSVGFNAIESTPRSSLSKDNPYYAKSGYFFDKAELLEISIVTIPANGEAVAAKSLDFNLELIIKDKVKSYISTIIADYTKQEITRQFIDVDAPEGHHWMDYKDGPVLMAGDDIDHDGASSSFRFELIEEHDPSRLKNQEDKEEIEEMQEQIDEEIEMEAEEQETYGYDDEDSDEDKEKNFLTNQERDLFALITTNGE
tara:strand:- start:23875 stop:24783 length:909 start_codon:yes stop_codon:yes gene_type:complete